MDGVNTMDLNGGMSDMTPVFSFDTPPPEPTSQAPKQGGQKQFELPPPINAPEKNISKIKMDSTPIGDIMGAPGGDFSAGAMGMGGSPDPRFMMEQSPMYVQQAQPIPNNYGLPQQQQGKAASKNPLNLTDEQMEALLAGVAAVLAFSAMVQGKLSTTVPQFLAESGERSNIGLLVTALLAAAIFYFAKKFVIKE